MFHWFDKLKRWCTPSSTRAIIDESGITLMTLSRRGPPWNYGFEKMASYIAWQNVIRVTAKRWDCYIYDTIGMEFKLQDNACVIITEDDIDDFWSTMERILPQELSGIIHSEHWYDNIYSDRGFQGNVIYDVLNNSPHIAQKRQECDATETGDAGRRKLFDDYGGTEKGESCAMSDSELEMLDLVEKFEHWGCRVFNTLLHCDYLIPMEFDTMYGLGVAIAKLLHNRRPPAPVLEVMRYVADGIEGAREYRKREADILNAWNLQLSQLRDLGLRE